MESDELHNLPATLANSASRILTCSHHVLTQNLKFPMHSSRCSQWHHTLSHKFCPKLNSHDVYRWAKREAIGKLFQESLWRFENFLLGCCESKWLIAKPRIELWDAPHNTMIENNENMYPQQQPLYFWGRIKHWTEWWQRDFVVGSHKPNMCVI
jgi:hypothetical protein